MCFLGCLSYIGKVWAGGKQDLWLDQNCVYDTGVVHEFLHAAGFHHEHSRPDRDQYITVIMENVRPDYQFAVKVENNMKTFRGFDFDSCMLYGPTSFAKAAGLKTMVPKNPNQKYVEPWERPPLSAGDIYEINTLYGCSSG